MVIQGEDDEHLLPVSTPTVMPGNGKNRSLDREAPGCAGVLVYSSVFLLLDVWKQVTSYGMKYYNLDQYPVAQTKVIAIAETVKFALYFAYVVVCGRVQSIRVSAWYAIPSVVYAFNNNIYLYALHYTTPPVWNILIQLRILTTAFTYRLVFKRTLTQSQWWGLIMLVVAIVMTNFVSGATLGDSVLGSHTWYRAVVVTLALAVLGSTTSVLAAITNEVGISYILGQLL